VSKSMDNLAGQHDTDLKFNNNKLEENIRQAMTAGMTAKDVVSNFNFPKEVNEYRALASVSLAKIYNTTPDRAYSLYEPLKKGFYPNISDEELVSRLFQRTDTLPKTSITKDTNVELAKKAEAEHIEYAEQRTEAEERVDPDDPEVQKERGLLQSSESFLNESIPVLKEQARKSLNDDWFGSGNQRDRLKEHYYDSLFMAKSQEERQEATDKYIRNLGVYQQNQMLDLKRMEYQIENRTWEEGFWDRKNLAFKRSMFRFRGSLARMTHDLVTAAEKVPNIRVHRPWRDSFLTDLKTDMRRSHYMSMAPELYRQELNWMDGVTNALIENTPVMAMTIAAGTIGTMAGGPWGGKAAMFWTVGSAEGYEGYTSAMANGFSEEEANKRAWIIGAINGGIETASGGITKYAPQFKHTKKAFTKAISKLPHKITKNVLKETLMEEIPQEVVTAILSGGTPYNEDGTLDWDEITNQVLLVARDAAFMAGTYSSVSSGIGKVGDAKFKMQYGVSKNDVLAYAEDMEKRVTRGKTVEDLVAKDIAQTEDPDAVIHASRFYAVKVKDGSYTLFDADEGVQYNKEGVPVKKGEKAGMTQEEIGEALDNANTGQKPGTPLEQLNRFTTSRIANDDNVPVYSAIHKMLDPKTTYSKRVLQASNLAKYVLSLRENIAKYQGDTRAKEVIPDKIISDLHLIPDMWAKGREITHKGKPHIGFVSAEQQRQVANELQHVIRLGQQWGDGSEAVHARNEGAALADKVKPHRWHKEAVTGKQAETGWLKRKYDAILGTSKDDIFTSLTKILGLDAIPINIKIQQVRNAASIQFRKWHKDILKVQDDLGITNKDKRKWSRVLGSKIVKGQIEEVSLMLAGKPHPLTMSQIMLLDLAMRDTRISKIMDDQGVKIGDIEIGELTNWEKQQLRGALSKDPKASAFVDAVQDFYINDRGPAINESSLDTLGYEVVNELSFLPDNRPVNEKGQKDGPFRITDIFSNTTEDIRTGANRIHIQPFVNHVIGVMNDKRFRRAVQKEGRAEDLKRSAYSLVAMQRARPHRAVELERWTTKIGANRARSILANLRIAVLQMGSYQLYNNEATAKYLLPHKVPDFLKKEYEFLNSRREGQGSTHSVVSERGTKNMWLGTQLTDYTMYPMHMIDLTTVGRSLNIAFAEMTDKHMTGKSRRWWAKDGRVTADLREKGIDSPEFKRALYDRAMYLAYMTQPMFFPESRNLYIQQETGFMREIARFRAFTDQLLRNNARQLTLWRQGEISTREMSMNIGGNLAWASLWYNGVKWMFMKLLNQFKEEGDEKEMNMLFEFLMGPVTLIPLLGWTIKGGINQLVHDDSYGPANFSTITLDQANHFKDTAFALGQAIMYSLDDEKDRSGNWKSQKMWEKAMRGAAEDSLIMLFGLPTYPVDIIPEKEWKTGGKGGFVEI